MNREYGHPTAQRGMALVLSLIFLAIVTLVSLSSMQGSITQGRMALNQQDYNAALQAAEAALYEAEQQLKENPSIQDFRNRDCRGQLEPTREVLKNLKNWSFHGKEGAGQILDSYYCIELVAELGSHHTGAGLEMIEFLFNINSVGFGKSQDTAVMLEVFFAHEQGAAVKP
ncbi:pilus assembly PilX family protein [Vreelandella sp. GE22]